jgi:ribosomal protein L1
MRRGKKYQEAVKKIEHLKPYPPEEAISLAKEIAPAKFDETVELHLRTGLDPRHADQQLRGTALLPNGLGKTVRVLVFAEGEGARNADQAGADFVGSDDLIKRIEEGWTDFDVPCRSRDDEQVSASAASLASRPHAQPAHRHRRRPDDIAKAVSDSSGPQSSSDSTAGADPMCLSARSASRRQVVGEHGNDWPRHRQSKPPEQGHIRRLAGHDNGRHKLGWRRRWQ